MRLTIKRVLNIPENTEPSTMYLTHVANSDLLVVHVTDNTGTIIKRTPLREGLIPRGQTLTDLGSGVYTVDCTVQPAVYYLPKATGSQDVRLISYINTTTHTQGSLMTIGGDTLNSVIGPITLKTPTVLVVVDTAMGGWTATSASGDCTSCVDGARGPVGPKGDPGCAGPQGPMGPMGTPGLHGSNGLDGAVGANGPMGPTGPAGTGGTGTGPQGPQGDTGPQGLQGGVGSQGPQGDTGLQGLQGGVGSQGATGLQGLQGGVGPQGADGSGGAPLVYIHEQITPATVWTVNHNLGMFLPIIVVDPSGYVIEPLVQYLNDSTIIITHNTALMGRAFIG